MSESHRETAPRLRSRNGIATYNIQVLSPDLDGDAPRLSDTDKRVLANLPAALEVIEEELEKILPAGYTVRVTEWNH
jgi:hypothetical protein